MTYSVHDEPDFERVYDEDEPIQVRKGDLRAVMDALSNSLDFGSGFLCEEEVEAMRQVASALGIDPDVVTPTSMKCKYIGHHQWEHRPRAGMWRKHYFCPVCLQWAETPEFGYAGRVEGTD